MYTLTLYDGDLYVVDDDDGEHRLVPYARLADLGEALGCLEPVDFSHLAEAHLGDEVGVTFFITLTGSFYPDARPYDNMDEDDSPPENTYAEPVTISERLDEAMIPEHDGPCHCPTCKMARFEDSPLASAVIQDYSYNPGWETHSTWDEAGVDRPAIYYLGVELETDNWRKAKFGAHAVTSDFPIHVAADMRMPRDFWCPKYDSSVTGPEFASHPGTLSYWRSIRPDIEQMFTMLLHAGYRSHDNDTCGLHVNISRNAFADSKHLYRFLTLIHIDVGWSLAMSQRTMRSADNWASFAHGSTEGRREDMADMYWSGQEIDHSTALNCPGEDGGARFEFRLPRGTLRVDRFYKNLEWTVGMIEFTRDTRLNNVTPATFMAWARGNRETYPDLVAYLDEKFPVAVAA